MKQLSNIIGINTSRPILCVAILCFCLIVYFFQSARVAINPADLEEMVIRSRSESVITDAKQRTYVNIVLFLQAGIGLTFFMVPYAIVLYRNQALLKRVGRRVNSLQHRKKTIMLSQAPSELDAEEYFIKRLLAAHPTLSPADLKLCSLLRQNQTSKEIALELNITPGSVNTARYRLRKKLGLTKETDLIVYLKKLV